MRMIGWKKKLEFNIEYHNRLKLIDKTNPHISINRQCELLSLSKSSVYYEHWLKKEDLIIMNKIDAIYTDKPFYGIRRIKIELNNQWFEIWRKKVIKYMEIMWIQAIYPKKKTNIPAEQYKKYPYLLKWIDIIKPNQVWSTDITYIKLSCWWVYLVAIIDWFSRYILSRELSTSLDIEFCISTLNNAIEKYWNPEIFNSDQWSQFTSEKITSILESNNIRISMDGKWRWADNIIIERLWRTIKYEEVYIHDYENPIEAYHWLNNYINFYNHERLHSSLWYQTPEKIYQENINKN